MNSISITGFPLPAFPTPVGGVKTFNDTSSAFGLAQRKEIFFSVKSGNHGDVTVWETLSGRVGQVPSAVDDIVIREGHTITVNTGTLSVYNAYIAGRLVASVSSSIIINIFGSLNINMTGVLDMASISSSIFLYGQTNRIDNISNFIISGTGVTVNYVRLGDQEIIPTTYRNVTIQGSGTKKLIGNTIVQGNFGAIQNVHPGIFPTGSGIWLDCTWWNLTVQGTLSSTNNANLFITAHGNLYFTTITPSGGSNIIIYGAPTVEVNGNISANSAGFYNTGTTRFTANSTISGNGMFNLQGDVTINSGVTLTNQASNATPITQGLVINGQLNGVDGTSTFLNQGHLSYSSLIVEMLTGTLNYTAVANTVTYYQTGSFTLGYANYWHLNIGGTGIKSLGVITTLTGNLATIANSTATFEAGIYDLTVNGTATININTTFSKTGAGNLLFVGQLFIIGQYSFTGNPNIEFRGGLRVDNSTVTNTWSSSVITFTANSQSITSTGVLTVTFNGSVTVVGAITVTKSGGGMSVVFNSTINGTDPASTLLINAGAFFFNDSVMPMATGVLNANTLVNTVRYSRSGNQDVKGGGYWHIRFETAGVKTLQGNLTVVSQTTVAPATVNLNGYTIT